MDAKWPKAEPIDDQYIKSSIYLMDAAHDFRNRLKNFITAKAKAAPKKAKEEAVAAAAESSTTPMPTKASVYVAKTFPQWQQTILDFLRTSYAVNYFC